MRALHVAAAGEQPQLSDLPVPEVAPGTVLVRVRAAGLNPFDNAVAAGVLTQMMPHAYPVVLGRDAAGLVEAVGEGVAHVQPGDEPGPVADQVKAAFPDGVDALVNLAGFTEAEVPLDAVRPGGKVATTTSAPAEEALTSAGLTGATLMVRPLREVTTPLAEQAAAGQLRVDVATVLPFERAIDGLATLAAGHARGKIVVTVD